MIRLAIVFAVVACGPGTIATPTGTKPVDETTGDAALVRAAREHRLLGAPLLAVELLAPIEKRLAARGLVELGTAQLALNQPAARQTLDRAIALAGDGDWWPPDRMRSFADSLAFSRDGDWLFVKLFDESSVDVYEVATGRRVRTLATLNMVGDIHVSPDGTLLAVAHPEVVSVFAIQTGALVASVTGKAPIAFTQRGNLLVSTDTGVHEIAVPSGTHVATFGSERPAILADGYTAKGATLTRWDREQHTRLGEVALPDHIRGVLVSPRHTVVWFSSGIALLAADGTIDHVWRAQVRTVELMPDDTLLAHVGDELHVYDLATRALRNTFGVVRDDALHLAASPRGRLFAAAARDGVMLWDARTGTRRAWFGRKPVPASALAFDATGERLAVGSAAGATTVWTLATSDVRTFMPREGSPVAQLLFLPSGELATLSGDRSTKGVLALWRGSNRRWSFEIDDPRGLGYDARGSRLATVGRIDEHSLVYVDVASGQKSIVPTGGRGGPAWSAAGAFVHGDMHAVWVGDPRTGMIELTHEHFALHPRAEQIALAEEHGRISIWDLAGTPVRVMFDERGSNRGVAWLPAGDVLATASQSAVTLWDVASGDRLAVLVTAAPVTAIAARPDGRVIAVGRDDGFVELWSVASASRIAVLGPDFVIAEDGAVDGLVPSSDALAWRAGDLIIPATAMWDRKRERSVIANRLAQLAPGTRPRAGAPGFARPATPAACFPHEERSLERVSVLNGMTVRVCLAAMVERDRARVSVPTACFDVDLATGAYRPRATTIFEELGLSEPVPFVKRRLELDLEQVAVRDTVTGKVVRFPHRAEYGTYRLVDETLFATNTPCAGPCSETVLYNARTMRRIAKVPVNTSFLSLASVGGDVYAFNDWDSGRIVLQNIKTGAIAGGFDAPAAVCEPDCSQGFGMISVTAGLALIPPNAPGDLLVIDIRGKLLAHHRVPICN